MYVLCSICETCFEQRGVEVPSFVQKKTLRKMLREIVVEEERKERRALVCIYIHTYIHTYYSYIVYRHAPSNSLDI